MKQLIQSVAHACGVHISRATPVSHQDSFAQMRLLCAGSPQPVVFDVGAHHGHVAQAFREALPGCRVFAFEPFPDSFEKLRANTASDPSITPLNFGLCDQVGKRTFHSNPSSATNSLLSTDPTGAATWGKGLLETQATIELDFKTVDAVLEELGLPRIDILKLDVQGAEPLVMEGAARACREGRIGMVYSEIITQPTYAGQKRLDQALAVFYDRGFDLHNLYELSLSPAGKLRQLDALFTQQSG